jgi:hypothetical protein
VVPDESSLAMAPQPAKKRKRIPTEAEGFLPAKSPPQPQRAHAPNFRSAFDQPASSSKRPMGVPAMPQPERRNPVSMARRPAPPPPEPQPAKLLKRPEPPVLPRTEPPSRVVKALPPALPVMPTTPMKALQTPELPVSPDTRGLKPLSTIPLSDISSTDDSVELSSFLLQLQSNPEQTRQDVLISPQKNKYLRFGASVILHFLAQIKTEVVWLKELLGCTRNPTPRYISGEPPRNPSRLSILTSLSGFAKSYTPSSLALRNRRCLSL